MNATEIINEFAKMRQSSTFMSVRQYRNQQGEVSNFTLGFHFSYMSLLARSIEALTQLETEDKQAKRELLESYTTSLEKLVVGDYISVDEHYIYLRDVDGMLIKNVRINRASEELHMSGLLIRKTVITPGEYKTVNSSEKTIAKNKLRAQLPISKYRQFILKPGQFESLRVEGMEMMVGP